jgi:hypothetical protein
VWDWGAEGGWRGGECGCLILIGCTVIAIWRLGGFSKVYIWACGMGITHLYYFNELFSSVRGLD